MNKTLYQWGTTRPFNSYSDFCKAKYGTRIQKVSINAGLSCPNRDGTKGTGGCTFCNNRGFMPPYCHDTISITEQIEKGIGFLRKRYRRAGKFVAYFQAYSNTHDNLSRLKQLYEEALEHPAISGISIGTRPDCIDSEKLSYLAQLSSKYFVSIEFGVESVFDDTLLKINRGHTFEDSQKAICQSALLGLHTAAHLIIGLPGESRRQILEQSKIISCLPVNSLKFHQLQIVADTVMAKQYIESPDYFQFFELHEYVDFMVKFLEYLRPDITIERFASEVPPSFNLRPSWNNTRSDKIARMIENAMSEQNTWQGKLYNVL